MRDLEEVTDMLSQPMMGTQLDEDDLLADFEAEMAAELEDELVGGEVAEAEEPLDLPSVPSTALPKPAVGMFEDLGRW